MQLETDQHWYALFGFFFTQQTDEQKLEIMQPWTREKVLVEMFDILKNGRDDRLKINLLIFLEENYQFFFSTHPTVYDPSSWWFNRENNHLLKNVLHTILTLFANDPSILFQGTCTLLNELLTLPTAPKILGNPKDPSSVSYTPYTPNHVKTQVLITLTTILVASEAIYRQPSTIESLVDILFEIILHVNDSHDRLLRQTAAEALRELSLHYSGLLIGRLGLLFQLARDERLHAKLSYTSLFTTAMVSSIQSIGQFGYQLATQAQPPDAVSQHFFTTLKSLGLASPCPGTLRLMDPSPAPELSSFQLPNAPAFGKPHHFEIPIPLPLHWTSGFRLDFEMAANYILEQIPLTTQFESIRLAQHLTYLLQTGFVSKDVIDDVADNALPLYSPALKSLSVNTQLLVRPDRLSALVRWALQTNQPIFWNIASTILSRIPIEMIQPLNSRSNDVDSIATTQSLTLMLRDDLLLILRQKFPNVNDVLRIIFLEYISRRPVHSDAENCAYLIDSPPTRSTLDKTGKFIREMTSFPGNKMGGSTDHAANFLTKRHLLYPSAFDSARMALAKFVALSYSYASTGTENRIPRNFMRSMSIFNDFPINHASSRALFQVLCHYLTHFPSLFDSMMQFIECVITEHVSFATQVWELFNSEAIRIKKPALFAQCISRLCRYLTSLSPPLLFNYVPLILELAKLQQAKVDSLLEALRLNLRVSKQLRDGEWSFGNSLIEIVHIVLLHHDIDALLTPACNLLATLSDFFADFEIRDRAHFYLQILTHIPADKVRSIIEVTSKSMKENLDVDNPFVNAETSKLNGFRQISFSSSSATSYDPNNPESSLPTLLVLEKMCPTFNLNSLAVQHQKQIQTDSIASIPSTTSILELYREKLSLFLLDHGDLGTLMTSQAETGDSTLKPFELNANSTQIQIPLQLRFKTPSEIRNAGANIEDIQKMLPQNLYSLSMTLTASSLYSQASHTIVVPFLSSRFTLPEEEHTLSGPKYGVVSDLLENTSSVFPYSYSFVLSLNVLFPLPTTLSVKSLANTEEGAVAELDLESVHIPLHYLFLPIPAALIGNSMDYNSFVSALFEEMWDSMSADHLNPGNLASFSPSSVKYLPKQAQFVKDAIQKSLSPFIVPNKDGNQNEIRVLIFLPHRYHLLLQFEITPSSTVIRIKSDWWRILTQLDTYFNSIFSLQT